jgi:uncharacterized protein
MNARGRGTGVPALALSYEGRPESLLEPISEFCTAVEIVPDCMLERGTNRVHRQHCSDVHHLSQGIAVFAHGIGLSISTLTSWNDDYLKTIESTIESFPIRWFSEHLGFTTVDGHFLGCMPAASRTHQFVDLIASRIERLRSLFGIEFVFEHVASPIDTGGDLSLAQFLNEIADAASCGFILDLHNLECEADNGRLKLAEFFEVFNLDHVKEIHLAGGIRRDGLHLDVHSHLCEPSTLDLFQTVLPGCLNVELVVFELLSQAVPHVGVPAIRGQLKDLKAMIEEPDVRRDHGSVAGSADASTARG